MSLRVLIVPDESLIAFNLRDQVERRGHVETGVRLMLRLARHP
jgi:hypothetical protein